MMDVVESPRNASYRCVHDNCMQSIADLHEALDHVEAHRSHANYLHVIRPHLGDHVYVNRLESTTSPWLYQHHGVVINGPSSGSIRICHFSPCDDEEARIVSSTLMAFSNGSDLFLFPSRTVRRDPVRFAEACLGKRGYSPRSFNCESFANLCITCEKVSHMNNKAFWFASGVAGTLVTAFGGMLMTGVWLAGKTAFVGKVVLDRMGATGDEVLEDSTEICARCGSLNDISTLPKCRHKVCLECGLAVGKAVVCPIEDCFEDFFQFKVNNIN